MCQEDYSRHVNVIIGVVISLFGIQFIIKIKKTSMSIPGAKIFTLEGYENMSFTKKKKHLYKEVKTSKHHRNEN